MVLGITPTTSELGLEPFLHGKGKKCSMTHIPNYFLYKNYLCSLKFICVGVGDSMMSPFIFFSWEGTSSSVINITQYEQQFEKSLLAQNFLLIFRISIIVTYKIAFI